MKAIAQTSLYYSEGSSDKEYHAEIVEVTGGNVVNFRYGRRGSALTAGTKTSAPVDFAQAKKIYDKLVKEKTSKGYTPDVSGAAYQGTENAGLKTDFTPQLLNPISFTSMGIIFVNRFIFFNLNNVKIIKSTICTDKLQELGRHLAIYRP